MSDKHAMTCHCIIILVMQSIARAIADAKNKLNLPPVLDSDISLWVTDRTFIQFLLIRT